MPLMNSSEPTPCAAMFDALKRFCGISHKELASLVLSERPLSDGRSPLSRSSDRTWLSRFIVHAPVGSLQPRYFRDYGLAAQRILDRIRSGDCGRVANERVIEMACGPAGAPMEAALAACHQDVTMYRNALERFSGDEGYTAGERAETVLVLFVAVGCSANVRSSVAYASEYVRVVLGGRMGTPEVASCDVAPLTAPLASPRSMGLMRMEGSYISGNPYWIDPAGNGAVVGSMAMGPRDISDVGSDVSALHLRVAYEDGAWRATDLDSTNGTVLVDGATGEELVLAPHEPVEVSSGDELRLGSTTRFMVVTGATTSV